MAITITYTFTAHTTAASAEVNSNFSTLSTKAVNGVDGDTVTGAISFSRGTSAPFTIASASAAVVTNLDADKLDGQHGSYYQSATNLNAGTVATARLGSGSATSSTFLRGDSTWASPTSTITVTVTTASSTYAILTTDTVFVATSGTFTATLPTAVGVSGKVYYIKNAGSGTLTLATTSSQTIDGATTQTIDQYVSLTVVSDGANWQLI